MRWLHAKRPGRAVRLGYCLNVHPAGEVGELRKGVREITVPLREQLGVASGFGVGVYFAGALAHKLDADERMRRALGDELAEFGLDPFTANAFPYGGFHSDGLKREVFRPTWIEDERLAFTLAVARVLVDLQRGEGAPVLAVSTHCGRFGSFEPEEEREAVRVWRRAADELARLEDDGGRCVRLAFEPEPRSAAGDTRAWESLAARLVDGLDADALARCERHLGVCLDTCHAAVEFEDAGEAWDRAHAGGLAFGKLQFPSALRLARPGASPAARDAFLALDEPRYLHQATARAGDGSLLRAEDLPELRAACADEGSPWRDAREWRCHFHVPVDLERLGDSPLTTTRDDADAILDVALADDARWGGPELAVEIETYTWSVLPGAARGRGALVDGLAREYAHVAHRLRAAGWAPEAGGC